MPVKYWGEVRKEKASVTLLGGCAKPSRTLPQPLLDWLLSMGSNFDKRLA
jgi:hypothetical protein